MAATNKNKAAGAAQVNVSASDIAETPPAPDAFTPSVTGTTVDASGADAVPITDHVSTPDLTPAITASDAIAQDHAQDTANADAPATQTAIDVLASTTPDTDGDSSAAGDHNPLGKLSDHLIDLLVRASTLGGKRYTADRRVFLTPDGQAIDGGHAQARCLLVGPGGTLPHDLACELGLTD